jgi:hypothetical protein
MQKLVRNKHSNSKLQIMVHFFKNIGPLTHWWPNKPLYFKEPVKLTCIFHEFEFLHRNLALGDLLIQEGKI